MLAILAIASLAFVCQAQLPPPFHHDGHYARPGAYLRPAPLAPLRYTAPVGVDEAPKPYSYAYESPAEGGSSSRQESSDGNGRVTGSYSVSDEDGRSRVVEYYADETGFHANVKTNEPGTANQNPADVLVESSAPEAPVYSAVQPVKPVVSRVPVPAPISYNVVPPTNAYYTPYARNYQGAYAHPGYYNNRAAYGNYGHRGLYGNPGLYGHGHGHPGYYRNYQPRYYY